MKPSKRATKAALLVLVIAFALGAVRAEAEISADAPEIYEQMAARFHPGATVIRLSLQECVAAAIENNLDVKVESYGPRIGDADVLAEKGVFDPHIFVNATYVNRNDPLPVRVSVATGGLSAVETEQWVISGGLAGAIPTGLTYEALVSSQRTPFSTITDFFQADGEQRLETSLTVTQPLLKNFGIEVNTTGIRVAVKNKEASVYQLEQTVRDVVFEVEQAYWELVFAYENLRVRNRSLQVAQDLLHENRIRLEVGVLPPLAVLQAETGVAVREEEVIVAQSQLQDAKDRLILAVNLFPDKVVWADVEIVPMDEPEVAPPGEQDETMHISEALRNRSELKQLLKQQEAAVLGAKFTKNQLLPTLNLNAKIGFVGLDESFDPTFFSALFGGGPLPPPADRGFDPALDDLFSGDNLQWLIGFTLEIPWGSKTERGNYKASTLVVDQLDASIRNLRSGIIQDVRNALRSVETDWERVVSTRETTQFRRESLEAEKKRFDVGVSTAHDVLEFEEELATAMANEKRSVIDYTISLANLQRATGILLEARNVELTGQWE
ncbi:MAG: TolC family protein [Candidatus Abyssubacteria bacterium]